MSKQYHIVGIAGAGMSAIAHMLLDQGHRVTGSDMQDNRLAASLRERGATVHIGHDPRYVQGVDIVVATSAVQSDHPELVAAQQHSIPILHRVDIWRQWSQQRSIIAIAGTHGKTTTTAMIAFMFKQLGIEAGFMVGAEFPQLGTNAQWGTHSAPLIIEADEYDRTFLGLIPEISVITNVEWDHPDIYATEQEYLAAFAQFYKQTKKCVVQGERVVLPDFYPSDKHDPGAVRKMSYGFNANNDFTATLTSIASEQWGIEGPLQKMSSLEIQPYALKLKVPGHHNVLNAMAAIAVAHLSSLDVPTALHALGQFEGVARRFELKGEVAGVTVVDDYAHHPTETAATLKAARLRYGKRRIVAYIQPHTFSRTLALMESWAPAFAEADMVFVGDVYPSRELGSQFGLQDERDPNKTPEEIVSRSLVHAIAAQHPSVFYAGTIDEVAFAIEQKLLAGDVLITMGAGDGFLVGEKILQALRSN